MFSPLFIKLSLATSGIFGIGTGGYFLYKHISNKNITSKVVDLNQSDSSDSPEEKVTVLPSSN